MMTSEFEARLAAKDNQITPLRVKTEAKAAIRLPPLFPRSPLLPKKWLPSTSNLWNNRSCNHSDWHIDPLHVLLTGVNRWMRSYTR